MKAVNHRTRSKDAQIARLQARVEELEARTSDKESDSGGGE